MSSAPSPRRIRATSSFSRGNPTVRAMVARPMALSPSSKRSDSGSPRRGTHRVFSPAKSRGSDRSPSVERFPHMESRDSRKNGGKRSDVTGSQRGRELGSTGESSSSDGNESQWSEVRDSITNLRKKDWQTLKDSVTKRPTMISGRTLPLDLMSCSTISTKCTQDQYAMSSRDRDSRDDDGDDDDDSNSTDSSASHGNPKARRKLPFFGRLRGVLGRRQKPDDFDDSSEDESTTSSSNSSRKRRIGCDATYQSVSMVEDSVLMPNTISRSVNVESSRNHMDSDSEDEKILESSKKPSTSKTSPRVATPVYGSPRSASTTQSKRTELSIRTDKKTQDMPDKTAVTSTSKSLTPRSRRSAIAAREAEKLNKALTEKREVTHVSSRLTSTTKTKDRGENAGEPGNDADSVMTWSVTPARPKHFWNPFGHCSGGHDPSTSKAEEFQWETLPDEKQASISQQVMTSNSDAQLERLNSVVGSSPRSIADVNVSPKWNGHNKQQETRAVKDSSPRHETARDMTPNSQTQDGGSKGVMSQSLERGLKKGTSLASVLAMKKELTSAPNSPRDYSSKESRFVAHDAVLAPSNAAALKGESTRGNSSGNVTKSYLRNHLSPMRERVVGRRLTEAGSKRNLGESADTSKQNPVPESSTKSSSTEPQTQDTDTSSLEVVGHQPFDALAEKGDERLGIGRYTRKGRFGRNKLLEQLSKRPSTPGPTRRKFEEGTEILQSHNMKVDMEKHGVELVAGTTPKGRSISAPRLGRYNDASLRKGANVLTNEGNAQRTPKETKDERLTNEVSAQRTPDERLLKKQSVELIDVMRKDVERDSDAVDSSMTDAPRAGHSGNKEETEQYNPSASGSSTLSRKYRDMVKSLGTHEISASPKGSTGIVEGAGGFDVANPRPTPLVMSDDESRVSDSQKLSPRASNKLRRRILNRSRSATPAARASSQTEPEGAASGGSKPLQVARSRFSPVRARTGQENVDGCAGESRRQPNPRARSLTPTPSRGQTIAERRGLKDNDSKRESPAISPAVIRGRARSTSESHSPHRNRDDASISTSGPAKSSVQHLDLSVGTPTQADLATNESSNNNSDIPKQATATNFLSNHVVGKSNESAKQSDAVRNTRNGLDQKLNVGGCPGSRIFYNSSTEIHVQSRTRIWERLARGKMTEASRGLGRHQSSTLDVNASPSRETGRNLIDVSNPLDGAKGIREKDVSSRGAVDESFHFSLGVSESREDEHSWDFVPMDANATERKTQHRLSHRRLRVKPGSSASSKCTFQNALEIDHAETIEVTRRMDDPSNNRGVPSSSVDPVSSRTPMEDTLEEGKDSDLDVQNHIIGAQHDLNPQLSMVTDQLSGIKAVSTSLHEETSIPRSDSAGRSRPKLLNRLRHSQYKSTGLQLSDVSMKADEAQLDGNTNLSSDGQRAAMNMGETSTDATSNPEPVPQISKTEMAEQTSSVFDVPQKKSTTKGPFWLRHRSPLRIRTDNEKKLEHTFPNAGTVGGTEPLGVTKKEDVEQAINDLYSLKRNQSDSPYHRNNLVAADDLGSTRLPSNVPGADSGSLSPKSDKMKSLLARRRRSRSSLAFVNNGDDGVDLVLSNWKNETNDDSSNNLNSGSVIDLTSNSDCLRFPSPGASNGSSPAMDNKMSSPSGGGTRNDQFQTHVSPQENREVGRKNHVAEETHSILKKSVRFWAPSKRRGRSHSFSTHDFSTEHFDASDTSTAKGLHSESANLTPSAKPSSEASISTNHSPWTAENFGALMGRIVESNLQTIGTKAFESPEPDNVNDELEKSIEDTKEPQLQCLIGETTSTCEVSLTSNFLHDYKHRDLGSNKPFDSEAFSTDFNRQNEKEMALAQPESLERQCSGHQKHVANAVQNIRRRENRAPSCSPFPFKIRRRRRRGDGLLQAKLKRFKDSAALLKCGVNKNRPKQESAVEPSQEGESDLAADLAAVASDPCVTQHESQQTETEKTGGSVDVLQRGAIESKQPEGISSNDQVNNIDLSCLQEEEDTTFRCDTTLATLEKAIPEGQTNTSQARVTSPDETVIPHEDASTPHQVSPVMQSDKVEAESNNASRMIRPIGILRRKGKFSGNGKEEENLEEIASKSTKRKPRKPAQKSPGIPTTNSHTEVKSPSADSATSNTPLESNSRASANPNQSKPSTVAHMISEGFIDSAPSSSATVNRSGNHSILSSASLPVVVCEFKSLPPTEIEEGEDGFDVSLWVPSDEREVPKLLPFRSRYPKYTGQKLSEVKVVQQERVTKTIGSGQQRLFDGVQVRPQVQSKIAFSQSKSGSSSAVEQASSQKRTTSSNDSKNSLRSSSKTKTSASKKSKTRPVLATPAGETVEVIIPSRKDRAESKAKTVNDRTQSPSKSKIIQRLKKEISEESKIRQKKHHDHNDSDGNSEDNNNKDHPIQRYRSLRDRGINRDSDQVDESMDETSFEESSTGVSEPMTNRDSTMRSSSKQRPFLRVLSNLRARTLNSRRSEGTTATRSDWFSHTTSYTTGLSTGASTGFSTGLSSPTSLGVTTSASDTSQSSATSSNFSFGGPSSRRQGNKMTSLRTVVEEDQSSNNHSDGKSAEKSEPSLTTGRGTDLTSDVSMVGGAPSNLDSDLGPGEMSADENHHYEAGKLPIWMEIVDALERLAWKDSGVPIKKDGTFDFSQASSAKSPKEVNEAIKTIRHHASRLGVSDQELIQAVRDNDGGVAHRGIRPIGSNQTDASTIASEVHDKFNLTGRVEEFTEDFFDMLAGYWERDIGDGEVDKFMEQRRSKRDERHRSRRDKNITTSN